MVPLRRVTRVLKNDSASGGLRAKAEASEKAAKEASEKAKVIRDKLKYKLIKDGVLPTSEMERVIEDLSHEAEPSKSPHAKKLAELGAKERIRQEDFRRRLNEEIKNDPEMQILIRDMNARIEQVTMEDVSELIKLMRERYGNKIK